MKNLKRLIALLILPVFFTGMISLLFSCSKDDDAPAVNYVCATCKTTPDALAANDASVKGVYKGIVVGSTGTISINIQNGSSTITATMVLDGVSVALTSNVAVVNGQAYVAPFTGTFNGSPISMTFSVGMSGGSPTMVSSSIPGHPNTVFQLFKETSTSMIESFEGTYAVSDGEKGTFNILLSRSLMKWGYVVKENGQTSTDSGSGTINGSSQLILDSKVIATIAGDALDGSFKDSNNKTITITGKRTL
ncbi:hypothetical protein SAMN05443549_10997 [Flavobacterium fluvii]|uniref:Uncharacterized protein n=1 Tax=Flavobacterium fluvii TaxID=468056 RepID=A0A1M5P7R8_9FLAO|nr:hypothetical protein [Flavobacterium fluvii]SHG97840.1 hypothetical protein SAMN05443549_10997 [Flavobacterium fluvii]